jgi:hypothetical protein
MKFLSSVSSEIGLYYEIQHEELENFVVKNITSK